MKNPSCSLFHHEVLESQEESQRLEALRSYQILDTGPEIEYDRITELASKITGSKMAVISFVESQRQWFKSKVGLSIQETPREVSFCHHAIQSDELFIIPDARSDSRFKENPFVTNDPYIRFYAGAPLINKDGFRLGTLCVFDNKKLHLSDDQKTALENLAAQVITMMELKIYQEQIGKYRGLLTESSKLAMLGELAASLAHEINNPLALILGHASELYKQMKHESSTKPDHLESVESIIKACQRVSNITKGIKSYSLNTPIDDMEPSSLTKILYESVNHYSQAKKQQGIAVVCDFRAAENKRVLCHPSMIEQVIINLLNNAHEAITDLDKKWIKIVVSIDESQHKALIAVTDSGSGIRAEHVHKIMKPFYTTKGHLMGTGLGLSISSKIAQIHKGELSYIESSPNTKFIFELPLYVDKN